MTIASKSLAVQAAGGMGTVYRAMDHATGNTVALKMLRDTDGEAISRFAHEARVLGEMNHPHVVRYVTIGWMEGGEPYLVMEWLAGETLAACLEKGALGIEETVDLGRRVAGALDVHPESPCDFGMNI